MTSSGEARRWRFHFREEERRLRFKGVDIAIIFTLNFN